MFIIKSVLLITNNDTTLTKFYVFKVKAVHKLQLNLFGNC